MRIEFQMPVDVSDPYGCFTLKLATFRLDAARHTLTLSVPVLKEDGYEDRQDYADQMVPLLAEPLPETATNKVAGRKQT